MDKALQNKFIALWRRYFTQAQFPICLFYSDKDQYRASLPARPRGHRCMVGLLSSVRNGNNLVLDAATVGCFGGKKYLGFVSGFYENFEYFLSYGIPGQMEGERYKKTPELVKETMAEHIQQFEAPASLAVFKRWDMLDEDEQPGVVIFLDSPDVISGLFTLANFDEADPNAVVAPFGAGCASIVQYPYLEREKQRPKAVLGMFDVSARPCVPPSAISFAVPFEKFRRMVENMEQSFLTTDAWGRVQKRISINI